MFDAVDTRVPRETEECAAGIYLGMFPDGDPVFVRQAFEWADMFFTGKVEDYLPIDARYHDFEHTLQGTLCLVRVLQGRHDAKVQPALSQKGFELGLLAILFHDTGYLKKRDDTEGTGAKYTPIHVMRSANIVRDFLSDKGWSDANITAIQNMIRCTGVNVDLKAIPFQSEEEQMVGYALSSADLLGQMAAPDYVEKLPVLYAEFAEAANVDGVDAKRVCPFSSVEDMMRKTPAFWERYVLPKLEIDFGGLFKFLSRPYPDGPNRYMQQIERNIAMLRDMTGAPAK